MRKLFAFAVFIVCLSACNAGIRQHWMDGLHTSCGRFIPFLGSSIGNSIAEDVEDKITGDDRTALEKQADEFHESCPPPPPPDWTPWGRKQSELPLIRPNSSATAR